MSGFCHVPDDPQPRGILHARKRALSLPPVDPGVSPCLTSKRTRASRYDWSRFSTAADSTCLNMCFIPSSAGAEFSAFPPVDPGAQRKLYEMFYQAIPDARAEVLDVVAEGDRSCSSIASVVRIAGSSSDVPAPAIASSGWRSTSTPFVTAKSSKTPS